MLQMQGPRPNPQLHPHWKVPKYSLLPKMQGLLRNRLYFLWCYPLWKMPWKRNSPRSHNDSHDELQILQRVHNLFIKRLGWRSFSSRSKRQYSSHLPAIKVPALQSSYFERIRHSFFSTKVLEWNQQRAKICCVWVKKGSVWGFRICLFGSKIDWAFYYEASS